LLAAGEAKLLRRDQAALAGSDHFAEVSLVGPIAAA
jgi:hypothetical protein